MAESKEGQAAELEVKAAKQEPEATGQPTDVVKASEKATKVVEKAAVQKAKTVEKAAAQKTKAVEKAAVQKTKAIEKAGVQQTKAIEKASQLEAKAVEKAVKTEEKAIKTEEKAVAKAVKMSLKEQQQQRYLACERRGVFLLLTISAGMMGAYTYNLRGGVFCNAQTANVVLLAMALGKGQWRSGLYYLIPITAYIAGAFVSEILPTPVKRMKLLRWDTFLVGIETLVLFVIGWIPLTVPHHVVQVMINFICSMQYNTFRQAEGVPMATTFCTNHVRQLGISLARFLRHHDRPALKRGGSHASMLLAFLCGGILLTACCGLFGAKTIWLAMIPMLVNFCMLARADLSTEHMRLYDIPSGHL